MRTKRPGATRFWPGRGRSEHSGRLSGRIWFSGNAKPVRRYGRPGQPRDVSVDKPAHKLKGAWVLYAALEAVSGKVHRHYAPRCNQTQVRQQLETLLEHFQAEGKRVLVVLWDNASWHTAQALRHWYHRYNQKANGKD